MAGDLLGSGTYGTVKKARHLGTGLVVAIKQFKESDEDDQVSADGVIVLQCGHAPGQQPPTVTHV